MQHSSFYFFGKVSDLVPFQPKRIVVIIISPYYSFIEKNLDSFHLFLCDKFVDIIKVITSEYEIKSNYKDFLCIVDHTCAYLFIPIEISVEHIEYKKSVKRYKKLYKMNPEHWTKEEFHK